MKTKLILLIGLTAIIAVGCLAPASKINAVKLGMAKADVIKIMGNPASITTDTNAEYLNYALAEGETVVGAPLTPYEIKLVNGKVESYGRAGNPASSRPVPMPVVVPVAH